MDLTMKSPLGIIPKKFWLENRFCDICEAIYKRYDSGLKIPIEWVEEYNELIDVINKDEIKE
jgi:hypothetical protein